MWQYHSARLAGRAPPCAGLPARRPWPRKRPSLPPTVRVTTRGTTSEDSRRGSWTSSRDAVVAPSVASSPKPSSGRVVARSWPRQSGKSSSRLRASRLAPPRPGPPAYTSIEMESPRATYTSVAAPWELVIPGGCPATSDRTLRGNDQRTCSASRGSTRRRPGSAPACTPTRRRRARARTPRNRGPTRSQSGPRAGAGRRMRDWVGGVSHPRIDHGVVSFAMRGVRSARCVSRRRHAAKIAAATA